LGSGASALKTRSCRSTGAFGDNCSTSRKLGWKIPMFSGRMPQKAPSTSCEEARAMARLPPSTSSRGFAKGLIQTL
jgi:hypothetical protein